MNDCFAISFIGTLEGFSIIRKSRYLKDCSYYFKETYVDGVIYRLFCYVFTFWNNPPDHVLLCLKRELMIHANLSDHSCALQKEILVQGRLYITKNYACFYSNIFGWANSVRNSHLVD